MIEVLRGSKGASVQDLGRFQYRNQGISIAGAMDQHALFVANSIVGNDPTCAALECSLYGPKLIFHCSCNIAIYGAKAKISLNTEMIKQGVSIAVKNGDVLDMGNSVHGNYVYLAVEGGIKSKEILGSRSYSTFISDQTSLEKGMILPVDESRRKISSSTRVPDKNWSSNVLSCYPGPEFDQLSNKTQEKLLKLDFVLSKDISRMGFRLESAQKINGFEILSAAVQAGTVQLTPAGTCIVMMRDCPVTGGYSRVLQLSDLAIDRLSQKIIGSNIKFELSLQL